MPDEIQREAAEEEERLAVARDLRPRRTLLTHMNHNVEYTRESSRLPDGVGLAYDGLVVDLPDP